MTPNPTLELNNIITPHQVVEMSFGPNRDFELRKADLMFDGWCQDNYGSAQEFFTLLISSADKENPPDGKKLVYAVVRGFYHLINRADQIFIRDLTKRIENPLDENGEEISFTLMDKLVNIASAQDITTMVSALFKAKGMGTPNVTTKDQKKKTSIKSRKKAK